LISGIWLARPITSPASALVKVTAAETVTHFLAVMIVFTDMFTDFLLRQAIQEAVPG